MRTALACLAISAVAALGGYLLLQREREQPSAVVVKDSIEAMSGPGGAASSLFTLHQGTSVRQLGKKGTGRLWRSPMASRVGSRRCRSTGSGRTAPTLIAFPSPHIRARLWYR